jgi:hypothetical protein
VTRELKTVVVVDGDVYGPGYNTVIPDYVASRITNPAAWGEDVDSDEGHGVPGDHEQLAAGMQPHAPVQPNQVTPSEPAGQGGLNPSQPGSPDTASSAVPAAGGTPEGGLEGHNANGEQSRILTSNPGVDEGDAKDPEFKSVFDEGAAPDFLTSDVRPEPTVEQTEVVEETEQVVEEPAEPDTEEAGLQSLPPEPPRSGAGSGEAAWRAFAESRDVQVSDDDGRAEIIAACKAAGVIQ